MSQIARNIAHFFFQRGLLHLLQSLQWFRGQASARKHLQNSHAGLTQKKKKIWMLISSIYLYICLYMNAQARAKKEKEPFCVKYIQKKEWRSLVWEQQTCEGQQDEASEYICMCVRACMYEKTIHIATAFGRWLHACVYVDMYDCSFLDYRLVGKHACMYDCHIAVAF